VYCMVAENGVDKL